MGLLDGLLGGGSADPPGVDWAETAVRNEGAERAPVEYDGRTYRCVTVESRDGTWRAAFGLADDRSEQRLFLFREGALAATAEIDHPKTCAVADDGTAVVADRGDADAIGGRVLAFDRRGEWLLSHPCDSNVSTVAVTPDGRYGAAVALKPDCETYLFDLDRGRLVATHEHREGNKYLARFAEADGEWRLYLSDKDQSTPLYAVDTAGSVAWESERLRKRPASVLGTLVPDWLNLSKDRRRG